MQQEACTLVHHVTQGKRAKQQGKHAAMIVADLHDQQLAELGLHTNVLKCSTAMIVMQHPRHVGIGYLTLSAALGRTYRPAGGLKAATVATAPCLGRASLLPAGPSALAPTLLGASALL